jgi:hypothetical protein
MTSINDPVLWLALSTGPNRAFPCPHLKTETDPVSETLFSSYLEFRTMDKVHKPSGSECYTPSSQPLGSTILIRLLREMLVKLSRGISLILTRECFVCLLVLVLTMT